MNILFSDKSHSAAYISRLLDFIKTEYPLVPVSIETAKRGFYGETWRLNTQNRSYFVKLDYSVLHQKIYEQSFGVIDHLCRSGIDFISRIIKTGDMKLSARFNGAVLGVFEWIDGENTETNATKIPEYELLAKIYNVPIDTLEINRENFSGVYAAKFFTQWETLKYPEKNNEPGTQLCSLFEANRAKLKHRAEKLKSFAELCRKDSSSFYITHGDAGGNFIKSGDRYLIVDWDDPVLAPPDRDAWVMCNRDWAREAFNNALRNNNIKYTLRPERLAYYCYHYFFFYLTEYLDCYFQTGSTEGLIDFFNSWAEERIEYADKNF